MENRCHGQGDNIKAELRETPLSCGSDCTGSGWDSVKQNNYWFHKRSPLTTFTRINSHTSHSPKYVSVLISRLTLHLRSAFPASFHAQMPHVLPILFHACYVTASPVLFHLTNLIIFGEQHIITKLLVT